MKGEDAANTKKAAALLKIACGVGLVITPLFFAGLVYVTVFSHASFLPERKDDFALWNKRINDFDDLFERFKTHPAAIQPRVFSTMLDELEESSVGAQLRLSLLKRRRELVTHAFLQAEPVQRHAPYSGTEYAAASLYEVFLSEYRRSAEKAAREFPHSPPVCALASEALLREAVYNGSLPAVAPADTASTDAASSDVKKSIAELAGAMLYTGPLSQNTYTSLVFSFFSLSGIFGSLEETLARPEALVLFESAALLPVYSTAEPENRKSGRENLMIDAAVLRLVDGGGELPFITPLDPYNTQNPAVVRFLARYHYDFGNPLTAGELFSRLGGIDNLEMAAAALYLADRPESAVSFWRAIADAQAAPSGPRLRSLYNLASLAPEASVAGLEKILIETGGEIGATDAALPAFVLYTRRLPAERALPILEADERTKTEPLLDIELHKRNVEKAGVLKTTGDTWLLLNRHQSEDMVYQWAAWYFEFQKLYDQSAFLKHFAEKNNVDSRAVTINQSLAAMRAENFAAAESLLRPLLDDALAAGERAAAGTPAVNNWLVYANLGLLQEIRRTPREALDSYLEALRLLSASGNLKAAGKKNMAKLYFHAARCYDLLRIPESTRAALEKALELDGDNAAIRMAAARLGKR
ncbi:MAG: hypothetical protein LBD20_01740 [Spirochaetaceae bacterium]|jgi:tetratricopeptide (TPR) repeat protein|nr:hypothetical protein [Spirochaetaceae bacterium]